MLAYVNAKAKILEYIKSNHLQSGDQLPTEVELANRLQIGRLSLREGLNTLKSEGIILSIQGKGTFLACNPDYISNTLNINCSVTEMIQSSGYRPGTIYFKKEIASANSIISKALKIEVGTNVPLCTRIRTADNVPVVLTLDYLCPSLATLFLNLPEDDISLYNYIEKSGEMKIGASVAEITPECATQELSTTLKVAPGTPLFVLRTTVNDIYGAPLIYAEEYFRADKFNFIVTRGR